MVVGRGVRVCACMCVSCFCVCACVWGACMRACTNPAVNKSGAALHSALCCFHPAFWHLRAPRGGVVVRRPREVCDSGGRARGTHSALQKNAVLHLPHLLVASSPQVAHFPMTELAFSSGGFNPEGREGPGLVRPCPFCRGVWDLDMEWGNVITGRYEILRTVCTDCPDQWTTTRKFCTGKYSNDTVLL